MQIKEHMPVVCSEGGQIGVVDHMEGPDIIKLAKDADGVHHYIPAIWVTSVDDKVQLDRTGADAMQAWWSSPRTDEDDTSPTLHVNSVDATRGHLLVDRVLMRKYELERALEGVALADHTRLDIEQALSTIEGFLTGDLDHLPAVVAADMNLWLERTKHVAESAVEPVAAAV
jgi:hypothetical protein